MKQFIFVCSMNISLQVKKSLLQAATCFNNNKKGHCECKQVQIVCVIIIYFTMASKQFRIYYVLAVVRSQCNIINNNNKVTVSVSKYKTLNNIKCLCDN